MSPANAAIRIGDKLILNCSSSNDPYLLWYKSICFDCTRKRISSDFDLPSYQISRSNGEMADLIMPSVTMDMAGSYVCGNGDLGVSSDVIVLGQFNTFDVLFQLISCQWYSVGWWRPG